MDNEVAGVPDESADVDPATGDRATGDRPTAADAPAAPAPAPSAAAKPADAPAPAASAAAKPADEPAPAKTPQPADLAKPTKPAKAAKPSKEGPSGPHPKPSTDSPAPAEVPSREVVRATGPPRRPPLVVQGLLPAVLAGALAAMSALGVLPLALIVLAIQLFLILCTLALLDAPASNGAFVIGSGAAVAADATVLLSDDGRITGLAGVVGLGLVAALVHQLARRGRSRVTESLADTLVVVVVAVAASCLLALRLTDSGEQVLAISLVAAGAVLLAGRLGDRVAPRPMLATGSTRGWPGLLLGLGAGVAGAVLVADQGGDLALISAVLIGLVTASTVATADLAVDLGAAELRSGWRDARRVAALRPMSLLLPFALLGPVALLAGRLVLD